MSELNRLADKYRNAEYKFYWNSSIVDGQKMFHWHKNIVDYANKDVDDYQDELFESVSKDLPDEYAVYEDVKRSLGEDYRLVRAYVNAYTHGTEGAPHTDSRRAHDVTVVVYLNKTWKPSWGGETWVESEPMGLSSLPKLGTALAFPSNVLHAARPISKACNELRVVMVFKFRNANNRTALFRMSRRDLGAVLKGLGAHKTQHSGYTLYDHLFGTYDILEGMGEDEDVCLAGLFHSIYGSSSFKHASVRSDEVGRNVIRGLIGERSERLAYAFGRLKRPECWQVSVITDDHPRHDGGTIYVSSEDMRDLRRIEEANLKEQRDR